MKLSFEVRPYRRSFCRPLHTAHGPWTERRGFLIRIAGPTGNYGYGEVAPAPWLGSETLEEAGTFLHSLEPRAGPGSAPPGSISDFPACRFGIDMAMADLRRDADALPIRPLDVAALLPAGEDSLDCLANRFAAGYRAFKWKIAVEEGAREREIFRQLLATAPPGARFRLDANGGLSAAEARAWLKLLDDTGVEFLEQPLPAAAVEEMKILAKDFGTPIALDESVGNARQFEKVHQGGWKGLYVVKPVIFGAMREGAALLPPLRPRLIFSSGFETSIGFEGVLRWASRWQADGVAAGLGTAGLLREDSLFLHPAGSKMIRGLVDPARIWDAAGRMAET